MKHDHICHRLVAKLAEIENYPRDIHKIDDTMRITGTAFFPGGFGLWDPHGIIPDLPSRPVVIVGNNWGTPEDHQWARDQGMEYSETWPEKERRRCPTWWHLTQILRGAGVSVHSCFFTNAYMGLKADNSRNVGDFPSTPDFDRQCREFLRFQMLQLAPSVVVAMGKPAIRMLSEITPALAPWVGARGGDRTLKEIYRLGFGAVHNARVHDEQPGFTAIAMAHTCDPRNLSKGYETEIALLRTAMRPTSR